MNRSEQLGPRLSAIIGMLRPDDNLWDICCDHAKVGEWAWHSGQFKQVHLMDQSGPVISKLRQKWDFNINKVRLYQADARTFNWSSLQGQVVIAGVGDNTIVEIIKQTQNFESVDQCEFVICAHRSPQIVRAFLRRKNFGLIDECVVQERGRFREIFKVSLQSQTPIRDFGSLLWKKQNALAVAYRSFSRQRLAQIQEKSDQAAKDLSALEKDLAAANFLA